MDQVMDQDKRTAYANQLRENPLFVKFMENLEARAKKFEDAHWSKPATQHGVVESFRTVKIHKDLLLWIKKELREKEMKD